LFSMRSRDRIGTLVAICVALFSCGIAPAPAPAQDRPDASGVFDWFDGLGYPDLGKSQFVKVATGFWSQSGDGVKKNRYVHAFLLGEDGENFSVFTLELSEKTYQKSPDGTAEHERVGFAKADLKALATERLDALRKLAKQEEPDRHRRWDARISERAELFLLARACRGRMLDDLSDEFTRRAPRTAPPSRPPRPRPPPRSG